MRKLITIVLLIPILFACNQVDPFAKLSGTIENIEDGYFILGGPGGARDSVFVNEDNTFEFEIGEIEKATSYYIIIGKEAISFRLEPNQQVNVIIDNSNAIESVKFNGKGADINNYLADKKRNSDVVPAEQDTYKLEYVEYKNWADNNLNAQNELLNGYTKEDKGNKFWLTEEANIVFGWASILKMYPSYHKYYAKKDTVILPDDYKNYSSKLDLNNPNYIESRDFTSYIKGAVRTAASEKAKGQEDADMALISLETVADLVSNQEVMDHVRVGYLIDQMTWKELSDLQNAISFLRNNVKDVELMAKFDKEHELWKGLAAGQAGIDFVGKDLEGNEIKFSDFKGKYVYVDVWATWCGPCLYEIPFLKKLEADYHDRNIVFISYSIDSDKQAWLDFVPKEELGGVQIIGENAWQSEMPTHYKVRGVPTFMFFDPEGKIVSIKMTRPSDDKTREKFDSYTDL